ncbi:hypothetical protein [Nannocystis pusilla]|uniref:hypothetical protein n=1 Tax=Nannocystis pusilla TaxID=889268 RepID=UPI003B798243
MLWGEEAAAFGSGGLFGLLAPYYLWSGWNSLKEKAPLLDAEPQTVFFERCATFAGIEYMRRLLTGYDIRDHADVKVGWASVSLLSDKNRGGEDYMAVRTRFAEDVQESGIDLGKLPDIKQMIDDAKKRWPGVQAVFDKLVSKVPTRNKQVEV